jgi:hypothetical protein
MELGTGMDDDFRQKPGSPSVDVPVSTLQSSRNARTPNFNKYNVHVVVHLSRQLLLPFSQKQLPLRFREIAHR